MLVDSLFALVVITGLVDADRLAAVADSFGVDRRVVFAVAWMETRDGRRWNALGPGKVMIDAPFDSLLKYSGTGMEQVMLAPYRRRLCREVGRFQLRSCVDWTKRLKDPQCTTGSLRLDYGIGIHCGVKHLADLHRQFGSWREVIRRQNGRGPVARKYVERAVAYIGRISLKARNGGISMRSGARFIAPREVIERLGVVTWTVRGRVLGVAVAADCGRVVNAWVAERELHGVVRLGRRQTPRRSPTGSTPLRLGVRRLPESDPHRPQRLFASDPPSP